MRRVLAMALTLALLVGCAGSGETPAGTVTKPTLQPTPDPTLEPVQPEHEGVVDLFPAERTAENEAAYADFAVDLLRASRVEGKNTLMSPLSVTLALGMTSAGAAGNTAQEFWDLIGVEKGMLSSYCLALMEDYSDLGGSTETNLVNSLWCDPDMKPEDTFLITCREYFDAEVYQADLQSGDTVKAVNDWVKDATRGMIPSIVERFDDAAVMALVNAVYFKSQFQNPFVTPVMEWTIDFQNADGTISQPQGMGNGARNEVYLSHENGQGVVMPYDDGKLGLLLMLPDEGVSLTDYLNGWDGSTIATLLKEQEKRKVALTVPKFKAEWNGELRPALTALGLVDAFDPDKADFTPMGTCENGPLYIGSVIHKTAFEVNEKGTEAAAVTAVVMYEGVDMLPDDMVYLHFDRPFVYGIVDLETGAPLFLGTMEQMA